MSFRLASKNVTSILMLNRILFPLSYPSLVARSCSLRVSSEPPPGRAGDHQNKAVIAGFATGRARIGYPEHRIWTLGELSKNGVRDNAQTWWQLSVTRCVLAGLILGGFTQGPQRRFGRFIA